MIEWWAKNSVAANLLMAACLIAGCIAYFQVERELDPSITFNEADISVAWPGASPQEIEQQIILRIEEAVSDVNGIKRIASSAREGIALIDVEGFDDVDKDRFLNDVKTRLDGVANLPRDAEAPVVVQDTNSKSAMFIALYGDLDPKALSRLAREIRNELSALPQGSPLVDIWRAPQEEVSIEVSENSLRRFGLTFDDVANAVRNSSVNASSGQVRTETGNVQLAARNLADNEQEFANIIIRQNNDGGVIHIADVAVVSDGFEEPGAVRIFNNKPSLSLAVRSPEVSNIDALSAAVRAYVEQKNRELGDRASLYIWYDAAKPFHGQLNLVAANAIYGIALVLVVLALFLRPMVALWVSAGVIVAFAGAFIFMPAAGVSLNFLSIFGFLLVIGVVVDDAIIVGESIHKRVEAGQTGAAAATAGAQAVSKPVFFAVLTTMTAFAPWLFISGTSAQFAVHMCLTVIFALTFSLIESFLILPAHLAHMKPRNTQSRFYKFQDKFSRSLVVVAQKIYQPIVRVALRARYKTIAIFISAFAFAVALMAQGWVPFNFQPEIQDSFISAVVTLPEDTSEARSEQVFNAVNAAAARLQTKLNAATGKDFIQSIYIEREGPEITSYLTIIEAKERQQSTKEIASLFQNEIGVIPDVEDITLGFTRNGTDADLTLGVILNDLDRLRDASNDLQTMLRAVPGVYNVRDNMQSARSELRISLKPGAERFGVTLNEVTRQVRQAFYGEEVQRLPREGQDVRVYVRLPATDRESLQTLEALRIRLSDGREIPFSAVAETSFAPSYNRIDRIDKQRTTRITAEIRTNADRGAINSYIENTLLPEWRAAHPDAKISSMGEAEEEQEFMAEFFALYALAAFIMYFILAIAFSSYWQPLLIMTAIPFGFMGGVYGHFALGEPFTLFSYFGVGATAGVVINDNLVLIDQVNRLRQKGESAFNALVSAGVERFRPIILTSLTTFIGLAPIMVESSPDAQLLKPTVIALAFGILFATAVTLIFIPAMYAIGADIARLYRWAWTGTRHSLFDEDEADEGGFKGEPTTQTSYKIK